MRKHIGFAELGFTVVCLLLYSSALLPLILSGGASEGEEGPAADYALIRLIFALIYLVTFFLLIARSKKVIYLLSKDRFIWVLVGTTIVSILWSSTPTMTQSRSISLVGTTLFGLYLAGRYSLKQQLQLLGWMFGIAIVLSLLFAVALPRYGIMGGIHAGAWRGIYTHKNGFGRIMILSAVVFLLLAIDAKKKRWLLWCGFGLSVSLLLLSKSSSSLINLMTLLALIPVLQTLRWRDDVMIPALSFIAIIGGSLYVGLTANANHLLGLIGKDATLTGRGDLWPLVWEKIWQRPWLGYGYSGFWQGWDSEAASIWYAVGWEPPNAHNGFMDLWLDLGLLGVFIYFLGVSISLCRAVAWVRLSRTSDAFWPLIYLIGILLFNMSETTLLGNNSSYWVLHVAVVLSLLIRPAYKSESGDIKIEATPGSVKQSIKS
jgi:O-antigen ligase